MKKLEEAGIIKSEDKIYRVIIDANVGDALRIYVCRYGDEHITQVIEAAGIEITDDD